MSGQVPFKALSPLYNGIYRGEVVYNNDPLKRGRCKVAIRPMMSDSVAIPISDLPWAIPAYPIFEGSGNGIGYFAVPKVGTKVFCFFEEGDIQQPVYAWEVPDGVNGVPSSSATNYPNRKVQKTTSGIEIIIDDTSKTIKISTPSNNYIQVDDSTNSIKLTHSTGKYIQIDSSGNVTIVTANATINASGATSITSSGAVTISGSTVSINP